MTRAHEWRVTAILLVLACLTLGGAAFAQVLTVPRLQLPQTDAAAAPAGALPDLVVRKVSVVVPEKGEVRFATVIKNVGNADAGPSAVAWLRLGDLYATTGSVYKLTVWGVQDVPALPAGAETTVNWSQTWMHDFDEQFVFLADAYAYPGAVDQAFGRVLEGRQDRPGPGGNQWAAHELTNALVVPYEANTPPGTYSYFTATPARPASTAGGATLSARTPVTTRAVTLPNLTHLPSADLIVDRVTLAALPEEGAGRVRLSAVIRNLGDEKAGPSQLAVLLYGLWGPKQVDQGPMAVVPALAPGEAATVQVDFTPRGTVQLLVYADAPTYKGQAFGQVKETRSEAESRSPGGGETNNVLVVPLNPAWPLPYTFVSPLAPTDPGAPRLLGN